MGSRPSPRGRPRGRRDVHVMPMRADREDRFLPQRAAGSGMDPRCRRVLEGLYKDFMDMAIDAKDETSKWTAAGAAMGVITAIHALDGCEG